MFIHNIIKTDDKTFDLSNIQYKIKIVKRNKKVLNLLNTCKNLHLFILNHDFRLCYKNVMFYIKITHQVLVGRYVILVSNGYNIMFVSFK